MSKFRKSHWLLVLIQYKWWKQNWAGPPEKGLLSVKVPWVMILTSKAYIENGKLFSWMEVRELLLYNPPVNVIVHQHFHVVLFTSLGSLPRSRIIHKLSRTSEVTEWKSEIGDLIMCWSGGPHWEDNTWAKAFRSPVLSLHLISLPCPPTQLQLPRWALQPYP